MNALHQKLNEEVAEYFEDQDVHELVDIVEVVLALAEVHGFSRRDFEELRKAKCDERGGFADRIFLVEAERGKTE